MRVTVEEVKKIIDTDVDVSSYIEQANILVNKELGDGESSQLKMIELNLTAHFIVMRTGHKTSEKLGDGTDNYQQNTGQSLKLTTYGQNAISYDSTGKLESLGKPKAFVGFL